MKTETVCRVCLSTEENMISIFTDEMDRTYAELTQIKIAAEDKISPFLCQHCKSTLQFYSNFRQTALKSYSILSRQLGQKTPPSLSFITIENIKAESTLVEEMKQPPSIPSPGSISPPDSPMAIPESPPPPLPSGKENKANFDCKICSRRFKSLKALRIHIRRTEKCRIGSPEIVYSCHECDANYTKKGSFIKHWYTHHAKNEDGYECSQCERQFETHGKFLSHQKAVHSQYRFQCEVCFKLFRQRRRMKQHFSSRHLNRKLQCSYCPRTFTYKETLVDHENIHLNGKLMCDSCGAEFESKTGLHLHREQVHSDMTHPCPHCPKIFQSRARLLAHIPYHVPEAERRFQCDTCGKKFGSKTLLCSHVSRHKQRKRVPKKCTVCGKEVVNISTHMRSHTDERPFQCSHCSMAFRSSSSLWKHQFTHTKKRPYNCSLCSTGYYCTEYLRNHMQRVHGTTL